MGHPPGQGALLSLLTQQFSGVREPQSRTCTQQGMGEGEREEALGDIHKALEG